MTTLQQRLTSPTTCPVPVERLREIRAYIWRSGGWEDNCTHDEKRAIVDAWNRMPGRYSFFDAVNRLISDAE